MCSLRRNRTILRGRTAAAPGQPSKSRGKSRQSKERSHPIHLARRMRTISLRAAIQEANLVHFGGPRPEPEDKDCGAQPRYQTGCSIFPTRVAYMNRILGVKTTTKYVRITLLPDGSSRPPGKALWETRLLIHPGAKWKLPSDSVTAQTRDS